jgi:hypothetical protein
LVREPGFPRSHRPYSSSVTGFVIIIMIRV